MPRAPTIRAAPLDANGSTQIAIASKPGRDPSSRPASFAKVRRVDSRGPEDVNRSKAATAISGGNPTNAINSKAVPSGDKWAEAATMPPPAARPMPEPAPAHPAAAMRRDGAKSSTARPFCAALTSE
jgi:hypothetical protein